MCEHKIICFLYLSHCNSNMFKSFIINKININQASICLPSGIFTSNQKYLSRVFCFVFPLTLNLLSSFECSCLFIPHHVSVHVCCRLCSFTCLCYNYTYIYTHIHVHTYTYMYIYVYTQNSLGWIES